MAGHSKWANIQHRKGAQDRRRGQIFSKLVREIGAAARVGGADPAANARLRLAIDRARAADMPRETIERAVQRGAGAADGTALESVRYEGYGPGGAAVLIECLTDNRNRTVAEVRHAFARHGGNLGAGGAVAYLFNEVGLITLAPGKDEERLMELALDAGVEDVRTQPDGSLELQTDPAQFESIRARLAAAGYEPVGAEITRRAATAAPLEGEHAADMVELLQELEELDDVQNVYSNAEIPDAILARL